MNFSTTREQDSLESTEHTEGENSLTGKIIGAANVLSEAIKLQIRIVDQFQREAIA